MRWSLIILLFGITGCAAAPQAATVAAIGNAKAEGRQLYLAKCAKCHKLYDPAGYTDAEWKIWMSKMSRKARLKPKQEEEIRLYVDQALRSEAR